VNVIRGRRSIVLAAYVGGAGLLAASPGRFMTVAQRDSHLSARAPRSADISADGRAVAFESRARLVAADADDRPDIYVFDRTTGLVTLESVPADDGSEYTHPRISGDGRFVVFEWRQAQSLNTPRADVVLRDRVAGTTRTLTMTPRNQSPFGWSRNPDISDDGRVVAFSSASTTLADGPDVNGAREDVYIVRLPEGTISRVSLTSSGVQPDDGDSILPSISADGRWIAFASTAPLGPPSQGFGAAGPPSQGFGAASPPPQGFGAASPPPQSLAAGPAPRSSREKPVRHVYLRDVIAGRTVRVTLAPNRASGNGNSSLPAISADGRHVVFVSEASNLLDGDDNGTSDVFLYDRETAALSWVSRAADGHSAGGESTSPVISGDGRFVAFQSDAANLVCIRRPGCAALASDFDDINLVWDVFVLDRELGRIVRASEDELGGWMEVSAAPALGSSGDVLTFSSRHPVDATDLAGDFDLFIRSPTPPPVITRKSP
jgi:Tol biopolymer transport system component